MNETGVGIFYVYALFRDDGRVFYIGKGRDRRWRNHAVEARAGKRGYRLNVIRDMQARGVEMPVVKIHEGLTEAVAHEYEVALIKAIGRFPDGPLANLTDGGDGTSGFRHTPEGRAKSSVRQRGKKLSPEHIASLSAARRVSVATMTHIAKLIAANRGKKMTREQREKTSAGLRGRKVSPETRMKISMAQRGRPRPPESIAKMAATKRGKKQSPGHVANRVAALIGKTRPPETRARMSAAALGRPKSETHREALTTATRAYYARRRIAKASNTP